MELKAPVTHVTDAGHKRRTSADDGHEPRQDYCFSAVTFEELFGAAQVIDFQQAHFPGESPGAYGAADRVVERIAENRCGGEQYKGRDRLQRARSVHCRQRADRKEQRIAGQERRDHEAGLGEDDHEQDEVYPVVVA